MNPATPSFIRFAKHPLKFRMFLFSKLPSAFFSGVRIRELDEDHCRVSVPYKWFSKNPFRSTYFACLGMAAELSTGALVMAFLYKASPPVSMLIVKMESSYYKKAQGRTEFTCADGAKIREATELAVSTGQPTTFTARSVGKNSAGEMVAEFYFTWSFKAKQQR